MTNRKRSFLFFRPLLSKAVFSSGIPLLLLRPLSWFWPHKQMERLLWIPGNTRKLLRYFGEFFQRQFSHHLLLHGLDLAGTSAHAPRAKERQAYE